jgi:acetyltransferase-like isoleucine patch superfamily enzyme
MLTDVSTLKFVGKNTRIYELAKLVKGEVIEIGDGTQIDDFVFIHGGRGVVIGRFNHIASFVTVVGAGEFITGDYVGISAGCRIITSMHHYGNGKRMVQRAPLEQQELIIGTVRLEDDVVLGTNAIVYPNVTIGEGAIIGAGGLVTSNVKPWTINVGMPVRVVGQRPRIC